MTRSVPSGGKSLVHVIFGHHAYESAKGCHDEVNYRIIGEDTSLTGTNSYCVLYAADHALAVLRRRSRKF